MTWRLAFLRQARSDFEVFEHLLQADFLGYCHRLHYLQMATEKLAKGVLAEATDVSAPDLSHAAFTRMLQVIKARPDVRRYLDYTNARDFRCYIDMVLPTAREVERLAPAIAGLSQPNPEYPWRALPAGLVIAPADFEFSVFKSQRHMASLLKLVADLVRFPWQAVLGHLAHFNCREFATATSATTAKNALQWLFQFERA